VDMNMGVGVQSERGPWWGWWRGSCGLVGGGFESRSDGREQGGREMATKRNAEADESDFESELVLHLSGEHAPRRLVLVCVVCVGGGWQVGGGQWGR